MVGTSGQASARQAQYNLGLWYAKGAGVAEDKKKAVCADRQVAYWLEQAAKPATAGKQGHFKAQYRLGLFHAKGEGVAQDDKKEK